MTGNIWALCIWTVLMGLELVRSVSAQMVVSDITRIVAFGDGLSDINNLYNRTSGLFPAAPYYQGRFSDGPIWLDFMSWSLGNSSANGVEVKSFANGASITNKTLAIPRWREETIKYPDLQDQLNAHLTDDLAVNRNGKGDTLYTVFAGMHDFMEGMDGNDYPDVVGGVSSTTAMINQLLFSGAKNVLVMNLPPMEFVPRAAYLMNRTNSKRMPRVVTGMAASWNHQLHKAMAEASTAHPGAHIALMDVFKVVTDVLVEGTTAFVNTKEPCYRNGPVRERTPGPMNFTETVTGAPQICKDPAGYVFWDGVYFTSRMHEIIASGALDMVRTGKTGMNGTFGSPRAATTVVVTAFTATPKPTSGGAVGGSFMGLGWVMALACGVSWLW